MSKCAFAVTIALATAVIAGPVAAQETKHPSQVTVPLSDYEGLKRAQEQPSLTVVDTLRLGGSFKDRNLTITFTGRASNRMPTETVLTGPEGIVLYGCEGDAIISRGEGSAFTLTPQGPRFRVQCRLVMRGSDRLELTPSRAVLWVESEVADGEFVAGAEGGAGHGFTVVRRTASAGGEGLAPTSTGRYKVTLRPDETRFLYQIEVHNPNRSRQRFEVSLVSGEHVQQVDASVPYDLESGRYRFDLPPGESTLTLSGALAKAEFTAPTQATLQYLLIESHPLLRPTINGSAKRVSPSEVGLAAEFRGAQAFLLTGEEKLTWTAARLEVLSTTGFALTSAQHTFFVPDQGPALGESALTLDNQGASDLSLPMRGEPTYAALQGETVFLTKDPQGQLWLPIAQGAQSLLVQHRQPFRRGLGLATASLELPRLAVPATSTRVEVRYPQDWIPLYEGFLSEARFWTPDGGEVVGWALLALWAERVGLLLGLGLRRRLVIASVVALAGVMSGTFLAVLLLALLAATALWAIGALRGKAWIVGVGVLGVLGLLVLGVLVAIPSLLRSRVASPSYEYDRSVPAAPEERKAREDVASGLAVRDQAAQTYQGLPAKVQLPAGYHRTVFSREMLDTSRSVTARVVVVSRTLVGLLEIAVALAAAGLVFRERKEIVAGTKARVARLRQEPEAEAPRESGLR